MFVALYYGARRQDFVKLMARNFTYASTVMGPIQSAKHGKRIDQMTLVYDFEGIKHFRLYHLISFYFDY